MGQSSYTKHEYFFSWPKPECIDVGKLAITCISGIINPTTKTGVLVSFSIDIVRMGTTQINRVVCSQQNVAIVGKYRKSQTGRQLVTSFQAVLENLVKSGE